MQQHIKSLLKDNSLYIAIIITISIAYLSLRETLPIQIKLSNIDKLEHTIAYCILSLSWFSFLKKKKDKYIYIILGCVFYGIIIEVLQETLTLHRKAELLDVVANSTGVMIGFLIFNQISKKNQVI